MKKILALIFILFSTTLIADGNNWGPCYWQGAVTKCFPSTGLYLDNSRTLRLGTNNTTNYVELKAPNSLASNFSYSFPVVNASDTVVLEATAETLAAKTLTGVPSITLNATGAIDWAAGNVSIGASIGANTMQLGGASSTIKVNNLLSVHGNITTDSNNIFLNNAAAGSGADWTLQLSRPTSGMTANTTVTMPIISDTLIGRTTTDTLTNKTLVTSANSLTGSTGGAGAPTGIIGEFLQTSTTPGAVATNTTTYTTVSTLTLTTGTWLISASILSDSVATQTGFFTQLFVKGSNGNAAGYDTIYTTTNAIAGSQTLTFASRVVTVASGDADKTIVVKGKSQTAAGSCYGYITGVRIY